MALITATEFRQHFATGLTDTAIDRLIADADAEIISRLGALESQTDVLPASGKILHLTRKASAVTSAVERMDGTDYELGSDDYELLGDGFRVQRLQGSTYPATYWEGVVTIAYTPVSQSAQRIRLEIDLVKLTIMYDATKGGSCGGSSVNHLDYQAERDKLFAGLATQGRRLIA